MPKQQPGFYIIDKHGFNIIFENEWTVSVQFGPGNYCDNYNRRIGEEDEICGRSGSSNAECATWGPDGKMIAKWDGDTVSNRSSPHDVLELLNWAASQKNWVYLSKEERSE